MAEHESAHTSDGDGKNTDGAPPAPGTTADPASVAQFTPEQQAHIDNLIAQRLKQQRTQLDAARAAEAQRATEAQAAEQGKFKDVAEQRAARIAELEAQHATLQRQIWIAQHGADLPPALAARVTGTTEDDIKADVAELRKLIPPPAAPNTEAGQGQRPKAPVPPPPAPASAPGARYSFQNPGDVTW